MLFWTMHMDPEVGISQGIPDRASEVFESRDPNTGDP